MFEAFGHEPVLVSPTLDIELMPEVVAKTPIVPST